MQQQRPPDRPGVRAVHDRHGDVLELRFEYPRWRHYLAERIQLFHHQRDRGCGNVGGNDHQHGAADLGRGHHDRERPDRPAHRASAVQLLVHLLPGRRSAGVQSDRRSTSRYASASNYN